VRFNKSDEDPLFLKVELSYQSVGIAFNVKNNPIALWLRQTVGVKWKSR
jgi:hypothetical protein